MLAQSARSWRGLESPVATPRPGALRIPPQAYIILAMGAAAWLCIWLWRMDVQGDPMHLTVSGTIEGKTVAASSRVGGRVTAITVQEGDRAAKGSLLAELEGDELSAQRDQLQALLEQSKAQAEKLARGPRPVDLAQAAAGVELAKAQLAELEAGTRDEDVAAAKAALDGALTLERQAQADLRRAEQLFASAVIPQSQVELARTAAASAHQTTEAARQQFNKAAAGPREPVLDAARAQLRSAQALYAQLAAGARQEDIQAAEAGVGALQAQLEALQTRISELQIAAPADGLVLTVSLEPGDILPPAQPLCSLLVDGSMYVQVFIPEDKLSWATPGSHATVRVDSLPQETFAGTVSYLSAQGEFTPRNLQTKEKRVEQVFRCKISLDSSKLRPGMACDVIFAQPAGLPE